jgi:hypothetical protein
VRTSPFILSLFFLCCTLLLLSSSFFFLLLELLLPRYLRYNTWGRRQNVVKRLTIFNWPFFSVFLSFTGPYNTTNLFFVFSSHFSFYILDETRGISFFFAYFPAYSLTTKNL